MSWLRDTPLAVVAAHVEMMGRLQAEEAMAGAAQVSVGRRLKAGKQQLGQWKRAAADGRAAKALPTDLGAIGIGMKVVKRDG